MKLKNICPIFINFYQKNIYNFSNKRKDPYQTLGVVKNATQNQIKKAYYKLAQQHHPDKNQSPSAKDKFSQINNAYQILSDQNKRKSFDQTGSTDQNSFNGFSYEDIFKNYQQQNYNQGYGGPKGHQNMGGFQQIFQDFFSDPFGNMNQQKKGSNKRNPFLKQDITIKIDLQFKQSVNGIKKNIQYQKADLCSRCKGTKSNPGSKSQRCSVCQGIGFVTIKQGSMIFKVQCTICNGQGTKVTHPCKSCQGNGIVNSTVKQEIIIPRGIHDDASLKFKGKGNLNGDLIIKINIQKHPYFKRQGIDCHIQKQISILDAVLGCQIQIKTIYDQNKKIKLENGTQNGQKIKLVRQGFYKINSTQKGNMIITIKINMPKNLTIQQRNLYLELRKLKSQNL